MKKWFFLCLILPAISFCQNQSFLTHKAFVVNQSLEVVRTLDKDVKVKIDYKLKIVSVISENSEDFLPFKSHEIKDLNDGKGPRNFFTFEENKPYDQMMLWLDKDNFQILLTRKNDNSLYFKNCTPL